MNPEPQQNMEQKQSTHSGLYPIQFGWKDKYVIEFQLPTNISILVHNPYFCKASLIFLDSIEGLDQFGIVIMMNEEDSIQVTIPNDNSIVSWNEIICVILKTIKAFLPEELEMTLRDVYLES